jgi:hypothetical protein
MLINKIIAVTLNSVIILIFNEIYGKVSVMLNDYENHRTETIYQDALIFKTAAFQIVNSYGALSYIAFIKEPIVDRMSKLEIHAICPYVEHTYSEGRSCLNELAVQLFSIFVVTMVVDTLKSICIPFIMNQYLMFKLKREEELKEKKKNKKKSIAKQKLKKEMELPTTTTTTTVKTEQSTSSSSSPIDDGSLINENNNVLNDEEKEKDDEKEEIDDEEEEEDDDDDDDEEEDKYDFTFGSNGEVISKKLRMKSYVELEFDKPEYDTMLGPFNDYQALLIQFGYATIFTSGVCV